MPAYLLYNYTVPTSAAGIYGCFDWAGDLSHLITAGPVLHEFTTSTRVENSVVNLYSLPSYNLTGVGAFCAGPDRRIYFGTGDGHNLIVGYNPATVSFDKFFSNLSLPAAAYLASFLDVNVYAIASSINSGIVGATIYVVDMTNSILTQTFNVQEHSTSIQPGNAVVCGAGTGAVVAAMDGLTPNAFIGVYQVTPTTNTRIGQLNAVDVDGSAQFTNFAVPCYDATDGNTMICVATALGTYLCKLRASNAALLWKIPIHGILGLSDIQVSHGQLQLIAPGVTPFHWYTIDTIAGVILSDVLQDFGNFLGQGCWSDTAKQLVTPLGNSPGTANWGTFGPEYTEDISKIDGLIEIGARASSEAVSKIDALALAGGPAPGSMITPKIDAFVSMAAQLNAAKIDAFALAGGGGASAPAMITPKIDAFMLVQAAPGVQHPYIFVDEWIGAGPDPLDLGS